MNNAVILQEILAKSFSGAMHLYQAIVMQC